MNRALWGICILAAIGSGLEGLYPLQLYTSRHLVVAAAYAFALLLCIRIQADYPGRSRMQLAWLLIAASCALAVVRYVIDWTVAVWRGTLDADLVSLRQIPIAITLILLTAGLVSMWTSFAAIGLGNRFRKMDLLGFAATAVCVPFVFSLREGMADAHSSYALIRHIQSASPILLAAPALVALALHRISHEMGQGTLALSLRLFAISLVLRLVSLWISSAMGREPLFLGLAFATHAAASWIFVQAVFKRWSLTVQAESLAERYKRNPAREIAELSQRLHSC